MTAFKYFFIFLLTIPAAIYAYSIYSRWIETIRKDNRKQSEGRR